jgi:hypothetical protein
MLIPNDWPLLCLPVNLSDEAAAQIADFLMELALWFESTHLSQIRRHHEAMRPPPTYDPNQLDLFDPF